MQSLCPHGQSEHVSTFALVVESERFLFVFARSDTLTSLTTFNFLGVPG
jgi:hypothetical protein